MASNPLDNIIEELELLEFAKEIETRGIQTKEEGIRYNRALEVRAFRLQQNIVNLLKRRLVSKPLYSL